MKRMFIMLLAALLLLSGCSSCNSGNTASPEAASTETASSAETEAAGEMESAENHELTLADAQVRFVYADDGYLLLAYYGPQKEISTTFCKADGTSFSKTPDPYNCLLKNGWRVIYAKELPDGVDADSMALRVTDYSAGGDARVFSDFGEAMTDEELKEIGVTFFERHACCITDGSQFYTSKDFGILLFFRWIAEDRNMTAEDWPFSLDAFTFFTGDGTPFEEAFEGYTFEVSETYDNLYATFTSHTSTKEGNEKNCDILVGLKPYMIYTAKDGTTQRFDLFVNY